MMRGLGSLILMTVGGGVEAVQADGAHEVAPARVAIQSRLTDVISIRSVRPIAELLARWSQDTLDAADEALALDALVVVRSNRLGVHDLRIAPHADPAAVAARLGREPEVEWATVNHLGAWADGSDPLFVEQYALTNHGQTGGTPGADIRAEPAWTIQTGDPCIVIAVLDSGTELTHPDLIESLWRNSGEIPGNGLDDDGNGFVDDVDGWDFHNNDNDPEGIYDHGTAVAGVIGAARGNALGIAGLAAGASSADGCRIMPLGVGDIIPDAAAIDDAILYAADNGARIISMSLAIHPNPAIDAAIEAVIEEHGTFICCAAGNSWYEVGYPASHPAVMAVAATDHDDRVASFSNVGPEVEVAAPGVDIMTLTINGGYSTRSGTSYAAPYVAALAGLIQSEAPEMTSGDVRSVLCATADDVEATGVDEQTGHGRINALAALLAAVDHESGPCPADLDGDQLIGWSDLLRVLQAWGACDSCSADLDQSGVVAFDDMLIVLAAWGACPG